MFWANPPRIRYPSDLGAGLSMGSVLENAKGVSRTPSHKRARTIPIPFAGEGEGYTAIDMDTNIADINSPPIEE